RTWRGTSAKPLPTEVPRVTSAGPTRSPVNYAPGSWTRCRRDRSRAGGTGRPCATAEPWWVARPEQGGEGRVARLRPAAARTGIGFLARAHGAAAACARLRQGGNVVGRRCAGGRSDRRTLEVHAYRPGLADRRVAGLAVPVRGVARG